MQPKPRLAPTLSALFGDPFIEGSTFEGQTAMPWSFAVLNLAMQTMLADQMVATTAGSAVACMPSVCFVWGITNGICRGA